MVSGMAVWWTATNVHMFTRRSRVSPIHAAQFPWRTAGWSAYSPAQRGEIGQCVAGAHTQSCVLLGHWYMTEELRWVVHALVSGHRPQCMDESIAVNEGSKLVDFSVTRWLELGTCRSEVFCGLLEAG